MARTNKDRPYFVMERIDPEGRLRPGHICEVSKAQRKFDYWAPDRQRRRTVMKRYARVAFHGDTDFDDSLTPVNQHRHARFGGSDAYWD
jgi:hypothetical protein